MSLSEKWVPVVFLQYTVCKTGRVSGEKNSKKKMEKCLEKINYFEKQLADDGHLLIFDED